MFLSLTGYGFRLAQCRIPKAVKSDVIQPPFQAASMQGPLLTFPSWKWKKIPRTEKAMGVMYLAVGMGTSLQSSLRLAPS